MRRRRTELAADRSHLDGILDHGNARAREIAERTLATVHTRLGMPYADRRLTSQPHRG